MFISLVEFYTSVILIFLGTVKIMETVIALLEAATLSGSL